MAINLTQLLQNQFTNEVLQHTANFLSEPTSNIEAATHTAVPLVVAGFINKASTQSGLKELYNALHPDTSSSHSYLDTKESPDNSIDFQSYINYADGIVNLIFGADQARLSELVVMESSVSNESAIRLFSILSSMTSGILRSKISNEGLGLSGFASFLMNQAEAVKNALPSAAISVLGIEDLGDYLGDTSASGMDTEKISMRMLMPWFIGLVALLFSLYYIRSCSKAIEPLSKTEMIDSLALIHAIDSAKMAPLDTTTLKTNSLVTKSIPGGPELILPANGVEIRLISFIEDPTKPVNKDTWFEFDRLYFKSASADMEPTSEEQLENIASILKAYPKVKIKLGGYTDDTGDPNDNLKLSSDRAKAAMNALISKGVTKNRLSSEGYGDQYPLGDNTTEAGRNMNRRVAIRVVVK